MSFTMLNVIESMDVNTEIKMLAKDYCIRNSVRVGLGVDSSFTLYQLKQ